MEIKVAYQDSICYQVEKRIKVMPDKVVLRSDLDDLADYRQISRALNTLVKEKALAKIGKGVYAKMRRSLISESPVLEWLISLVFRIALIDDRKKGLKCLRLCRLEKAILQN